MLHISDLTIRIGDRLLFDQATVAIPAGHKVGLVGRNGAGKSTLLQMVIQNLHPESGSLTVRNNAKIGMVAQEAPDGPQNLIETVLLADEEMTSLNAEAETATDPNRIAEIHTRLADIGAHTAEARAASILVGLGFDAEAQLRPCGSFSGGWRMRVALASVLFVQPDLLLLDEPTNYLDLEGVMWLESFLKTYPYTILIVSHDRSLLNKSVKGILHLSEGKLNYYTGGYDRFEELRSEKMSQQMALKSKQERERKHIQGFVDRFKAQASKAKQAQSRIKALARMKPIASMVAEHTTPFIFPKPEPLSSPLIVLETATAAYDPEVPILKDLDLRVDMDDRIALLGANGNGKSTFAKLLASKMKPITGKMRKSSKLVVGYFAQHQLDELNENSTPYELMREVLPENTIESRIRGRLGSFGFGFDKADRAISSLSGGEQARLMFAMATIHKPQLLILDEPTNHLDVDSCEALIHAINGYDGAVLLISHDRHLLEACVDRLWLVDNADVTPYDGDLDDYRDLLLAKRSTAKKSKNSEKSADKKSGGGNRKAMRKAAADARARRAPLKKAVNTAEAQMTALDGKLAVLQTKLANPKLYDGSYDDGDDMVQTINKAITAVEADMHLAEAIWMEASEVLEKAKAADEASL